MHVKVSFRKWRPPGRDTNRRAMRVVPLPVSSRDPVNVGRLGGRTVVDRPSRLLPSLIDHLPWVVTLRSWRGGKERMKSKNCEDSRGMVRTTWRDLMTD